MEESGSMKALTAASILKAVFWYKYSARPHTIPSLCHQEGRQNNIDLNTEEDKIQRAAASLYGKGIGLVKVSDLGKALRETSNILC